MVADPKTSSVYTTKTCCQALCLSSYWPRKQVLILYAVHHMELWKYADLCFKQTSCLMVIAFEMNGVFIKTVLMF